MLLMLDLRWCSFLPTTSLALYHAGIFAAILLYGLPYVGATVVVQQDAQSGLISHCLFSKCYLALDYSGTRCVGLLPTHKLCLMGTPMLCTTTRISAHSCTWQPRG